MLAVLFSSGPLLLALLTGASYSYPAEQARGFEVASAPVRHPATLAGGLNFYHPPSVQREPSRASYNTNFLAGSLGSFPAGSAQQSSFQPGHSQDLGWADAPRSHFSGEETLGRLEASRYASFPVPYVSPPHPPLFQGGELSHMEDSFEHGKSETEKEVEDFLQPPPGVQASTRELQLLGPCRGCTSNRYYGYPFDQMFSTNQYPPGKITHMSSSFELGRNSWEDSHYLKPVPLSSPSSKQIWNFKTEFEDLQKRPGSGYGAHKVRY